MCALCIFLNQANGIKFGENANQFFINYI